MSGEVIVAAGIGMLFFSLILFIASIVYRKKVGSNVRKELLSDYSESNG